MRHGNSTKACLDTLTLSLSLTLTLTLKASHQLKLDATGKNVFAVLRHVGR